ncbi:MAG: SHOCT-like domain-containing protein [Spirochaetia bacterium]
MKEERMKILSMVQEGKITPEDAEKLLGKMDEQDKSAQTAVEKGGIPKYLYVRVDPKEGKKTDHGRVRVRVPVSLVKSGMSLAALMPKDVHEKVDSAMNEKGMGFKLSELSPENIDRMLMSLRELEVDVDTPEETVKIYCE